MLATLAAPATAFAQSSGSGDAAATGIGAVFLIFAWLFLVFYGLALLAGLAGIVLWVLAIVDVAQRPDAAFPNAIHGQVSPNEKLIWLIVVLLGWVVGAAVYYFVVMRPHPRSAFPVPQPHATPPQPPQPPQPPA
jgi:membrane-associated phospholipid phosphatase